MDIIDVPKFDDILLKISEVRKKKHFDRRKRIITLSRSNSSSPTQHSRSTSKVISTSTLSSAIISPREVKTESFFSANYKTFDKLKTQLAKLPNKQNIFLPDKLNEVKKYYGNKIESPRNMSDRTKTYPSYKLDAASLIFESLENLMKYRLKFIIKQFESIDKVLRREEPKPNKSLKKFDIDDWWNSIEKRPPKIKIESEETISLSKSIVKDLSPTQIKPRYSNSNEPEVLKRSIKTIKNLKPRSQSPREIFKIPSKDQIMDAVSTMMHHDSPYIFSTFESSPALGGSASRIEVFGENTFDSDSPFNILLTRGTAESHDSNSSKRFNPVQSRCSSPTHGSKITKTKDYRLCISSYNSEQGSINSQFLIGGAKFYSFMRGKIRSYKIQSIYILQLYARTISLMHSQKISSLKSLSNFAKSFINKRAERAFSLWKNVMKDDKRLEGLENVLRGWRDKRMYIRVIKTWRKFNENNMKVTRALEMLSIFKRKKMADYFDNLMSLVRQCSLSMSSIGNRYSTPSKREISFDFM